MGFSEGRELDKGAAGGGDFATYSSQLKRACASAAPHVAGWCLPMTTQKPHPAPLQSSIWTEAKGFVPSSSKATPFLAFSSDAGTLYVPSPRGKGFLNHAARQKGSTPPKTPSQPVTLLKQFDPSPTHKFTNGHNSFFSAHPERKTRFPPVPGERSLLAPLCLS